MFAFVFSLQVYLSPESCRALQENVDVLENATIHELTSLVKVLVKVTSNQIRKAVLNVRAQNLLLDLVPLGPTLKL